MATQLQIISPIVQYVIGTQAPCYDLSIAGDDPDTLIPTYVAGVPMDPQTGTPEDTDYTIYKDVNGRIVASASGELITDIGLVR